MWKGHLLLPFLLQLAATQSWDEMFIVAYDSSALGPVVEVFGPKRCMSVEYPRSDRHLVVYDEYVSVYCTCFGELFEPVCPKWVVTTGRESVYVAESRMLYDGSSCTSALLIGPRLGHHVGRKNVTLKCLLPDTDWKVPEFSFLVTGSKFDYWLYFRHHPLFMYGILCWFLGLLLLIVCKGFSGKKPKYVRVYSIPCEAQQSKEKGQKNSTIYEFSLKVKEEDLAAFTQNQTNVKTDAKVAM